MEKGVSTRLGWRYQGLIEDVNGYLHPQTYEDNVFRVACHSILGAISDRFARKLDSDNAFQSGWHHWSQKGIKGIPEAKTKDGMFEYTRYLDVSGAGDEF